MVYILRSASQKKSGALACAQRCASGARPGRGRGDGRRRGPWWTAAKGRVFADIPACLARIKTLGCVWELTATLARHGAAKRHRAARCSGCCKIKPKGHRSFDSSVKKTRLTFHRDLHAPPKSEERVLRISSEFMRRAGMAAHALVFGRAAHDRPRPRPTEKGRANS